MAETASIAKTVASLARPGMKPKELISAVRTEHPEATKKDIARAAFYAVILASEEMSNRVEELHDIAIETRNSSDDSALNDH